MAARKQIPDVILHLANKLLEKALAVLSCVRVADSKIGYY